VDRLDYVTVPSSARDAFNQSGNHNGEKAITTTAVRIMVYKTGTAPDFMYFTATKKRSAEENMWQVKICVGTKQGFIKPAHLQRI
jgi:hypothetical protein